MHADDRLKVTIVYEGAPHDIESAIHGAHRDLAEAKNGRSTLSDKLWRTEEDLRASRDREMSTLRRAEGAEARERSQLTNIARLTDENARLRRGAEPAPIDNGFGVYPANQVEMTFALKSFIAFVAKMPAASGAGENRIGCIKMVRETYGVGLKEAKDLVEWCLDIYPVTLPKPAAIPAIKSE